MSDHETDEIGVRIRASAESVSAPLRLREELARRPARPPGPSRLRLAIVGGMLAVIATIAGILAPGAPSVERVAAAALAAPTDPPPDGPSYLPGYRAVGTRTDTVSGRTAETIVYRSGDEGIHYTVVDGKPLDLPGTRRTEVEGLEVALARDGDVNLVVWHAGGKTCILASRTAGLEDMTELIRRA
jgi:hypothetical protein